MNGNLYSTFVLADTAYSSPLLTSYTVRNNESLFLDRSIYRNVNEYTQC